MYEYLRAEYPRVYVISFPDGMVVPFKPLTYGEFNQYTHELELGLRSPADLENEIFQRCVLDQSLTLRMLYLKAGTISSTVQSVMDCSGPSTTKDFNNRLSQARIEAQSPKNFLAALICRVFPSYTPGDVDQMTYDEVMLRLAQAEPIALEYGIIGQNIFLQAPEEQQIQHQAPPPRDLKAAWDASMKMQGKELPAEASEPGVSPALIQSNDIMSLVKDGLGNMDSYSEDSRLRHQMLQDASWIYKDLAGEAHKKKMKREPDE